MWRTVLDVDVKLVARQRLSHRKQFGTRSRTRGTSGFTATRLLALAHIACEVEQIAIHGSIVAVSHEKHVAPSAVPLASPAKPVPIIAERFGSIVTATHITCWGDRRRTW